MITKDQEVNQEREEEIVGPFYRLGHIRTHLQVWSSKYLVVESEAKEEMGYIVEKLLNSMKEGYDLQK